jgi:hypothetical protein
VKKSTSRPAGRWSFFYKGSTQERHLYISNVSLPRDFPLALRAKDRNGRGSCALDDAEGVDFAAGGQVGAGGCAGREEAVFADGDAGFPCAQRNVRQKTAAAENCICGPRDLLGREEATPWSQWCPATEWDLGKDEKPKTKKRPTLARIKGARMGHDCSSLRAPSRARTRFAEI